MKPIFCFDSLKVALVGGVGVFISSLAMATDNSSIAVKSTDLTLPVLTVSQGDDGKWSGRVIDLELTVSRKSDNRPLLVAIAEDRPSGVGEQFRAAMWSAASTVALERGDPLRGCKLELTAQDVIDGPSAGAMITFGVMSALDGKTMTNDFAFTGTILPNGSVGYVGGVVQKIEAAKVAGKRRIFVPAYYRAEKDLNTGEIVDLKEKCQSLNLHFIPVSNIRQAYALINNVKETPYIPPNLDLPDKVEDLFNKLYKRESKSCEAVFESLSLEEKSAFTNVIILKAFYLDTKNKADSAYRAGNLPGAYDKISDLPAILEAYKDTRQYLVVNNLYNISLEKYFNSVDLEIDKQNQKHLSNISNYLHSICFSNPIAAQFDNLFVEISQWSANNDFLAANATQEATNAAGSQDADQRNLLIRKAEDVKFLQLMIAYLWEKSHSIQDFSLFATLFNQKEIVVNKRHRAIEQLLYTTMESAFVAYNANTLNQIAEKADTTPNKVNSYLEATDLNYMQCVRSRQTSEVFRQGINDGTALNSLFSLSRSHAHAIAIITAQTIRGDLEYKKDEAGQTRYGNTSLLRAMLQSSREEALAAIEHCQKLGVTCWGPVAAIHIADAERDDPDKDKVDVFEKYLEAALDAKILTLMFSTN